MKTLEDTKKGLACIVAQATGWCDVQESCDKCEYVVSDSYFVEENAADALVHIQQLEQELEPLRKAKEEGRLIILPYAPGTPVYIVDDYDVVQMKYHPSMYGRRCHTSKEELYKEFYKEIGVKI